MFLDDEPRVLSLASGLAPWRIAAASGATRAPELAAGECAGRRLRVGERLELRG